MIIKSGFGEKPTSIRVYGRENELTAEFWIEQEGLKVDPTRYETLSYITLEELIALRDEINKAIKEMVGV